MWTEEVLAPVLRLPRPERARLAEEVLSSLEDPDEQVARAWAQELERRSREIDEGHVQPIDWDTVRLEILKELKQTALLARYGCPQVKVRASRVPFRHMKSRPSD